MIKQIINRIFPLGRRSILFGVHHFLWHPYTVFLAWKKLYGWPSWQEVICIFIHDWGYWNCRDMDGDDGRNHPELGCRIAYKILGQEYANLCMLHSRKYVDAFGAGAEPSKLCYADKLSIEFEPWWFYLFRARLSGELNEYRSNAAQNSYISFSATNKEWFEWVQCTLSDFARTNCYINKALPKSGTSHNF